MNSLNNWDITMISSISSFALSFFSLLGDPTNYLTIVSSVSAIILCLTSIVKFIDLVLEKWKKWKEKD